MGVLGTRLFAAKPIFFQLSRGSSQRQSVRIFQGAGEQNREGREQQTLEATYVAKGVQLEYNKPKSWPTRLGHGMPGSSWAVWPVVELKMSCGLLQGAVPASA